MSCINNSGNINETFIIEAQQVVSADTFVTGFTLSLNNLILTQNRDDQYSAFTVSLSGITGSSTSVSGAYLPLSGGTVTGGTSFISGLTATSLNLTSVVDSNADTKVLSIDSSGNVNFIYKSAVTASSTANTFTTGATYSVSTGILTFKRNDDVEYTAGTFNYITGSTQNGNTLTLTSNSGGTFTYTPSVLTGSFLPLSGGTVSGNTIFTSGLTATTISATTISGGTFYGNGSNLTGIQNIYTSDGVLTGNRVVDMSGYNLTLSGSTRISYSSTSFTDSPLIIKNTNPSAVVANTISFDCDATGADQPIFMNFAGPNPRGFGFYASDTDITNTPDGAAFQMFKNTSVNFPGSVFFDSGANDNAAIRFRTAVSNGTITDRMIITSDGEVGINTLSPVASLDVRGGGHIGVGTPSIYAGNSHTLEITTTGTSAPLTLIGGSTILEIWADNTPTKAISYGAAYPGLPADGNIHFATYNTITNWIDRIIVDNTTGYVGVATSSITNTLHVSASTNPVRFEGLTSATDSNLLTVDSSGVVHTIAVSAISSSSSANTFVTGFTLSSNTITLTQNRGDEYSAFTISLSAYTGSSSTSGAYLPLSGGTVTGGTIFQSGVTANTISGGTYLGNGSGLTGIFSSIRINDTTQFSAGTNTFINFSGVNISILSGTGNTLVFSASTSTPSVTSGAFLPLSGGTVSGSVFFTSAFTANILTVTGNTNLASVTANTLTVTGNTRLASVTANTLNVTGVTRLDGVTADTLTVTGNTRLAGLTATTISAGTYSNLPNTLYTGNGALSGNRLVDIGGNQLYFSGATNANALMINTTGVGIKTSSPSYNLEVQGTVGFGDNFKQGNLTTNSVSLSSFTQGESNKATSRFSHAEGYGNSTVQLGILLLDSNMSNGVITFDSSSGDITAIFTTEYVIIDTRQHSNDIGINIYKIKNVTWDLTNTILTLYNTTLNTSDRFIVGIPNVYQPSDDFTVRIRGDYSHVQGYGNFSDGLYSHAEGSGSTTMGSYSHSEGYGTISVGNNSHSEGSQTKSFGSHSHAEGNSTYTLIDGSHAEGLSAFTGQYGYETEPNISSGTILIKSIYGNVSSQFADTGGKNIFIYDDTLFDNAYGLAAFRVGAVSFNGTNTVVTADFNLSSTLSAYISPVGNSVPLYADKIIGSGYSHSEGVSTKALGYGSHAQGSGTTSVGRYSFASGIGTTADVDGMAAVGKYNALSNSDTLFVIGNGDESGASNLAVFGNTQITFSEPLEITSNNALKITTLTNNSVDELLLSVDNTGVIRSYNVSNVGVGRFLPLSGGTVTGATRFTSGLSANTISGGTYLGNGSGLTGVFNSVRINNTTQFSAGANTFINFSGVNISILSGTGNTLVFSASTSTPSVASGAFLPLSGGTVTGGTIFQSGLTANTISATTYYNLPTDVYVTGGTYTNGNAIFTNNTGGTFNVSGFAIGGGGGQIFYLNLSQSQNGNRLLSTTASTSSEQTSGVTIGNGVTGSIASFQTTPLNISLIPGGIWSFYLHSYKENSNASFNIFVEVYKITSGGSQTLLFATDPTSVTTNSPNPSMQLTDGYFSGTPLSVSDGVVAVVKATNTGNQSHSITLVTEGSAHYSYVVSTIPTQQGLTCDTLSGCSIIQTIQTDVSNKLDKSGGTVNGATDFTNGLSANTISATTWYGLPPSTFSGGTVNGATNFTNGLTANTISATTYENVNAVTGGTYNSVAGVITLSGTGNVNGNTITGFSTGSGGLTWQFTTTPITASTNNGYITTGTTSIALPTTASLGSTIEVVAASDNLFTITQNTNQFIRFGIITTTPTSGTLVSQNNGDSIRLVCTSADTIFTVVSSVGTLTLN